MFDTSGISSVQDKLILEEKRRFRENEFTLIENELFDEMNSLYNSEEYIIGKYIQHSKFRFVYDILMKMGKLKNKILHKS